MSGSGGHRRPAAEAVPLSVSRGHARGATSSDVPYGVLDVGSNSIRLVVFESLTRSPAPIFNERELCGLGSELAETGRLAAAAIDPALEALYRFAAVARVLGVEDIDAVTTAAVRDAEDGDAFSARVAHETGFTLRTLSGEEEARYAALGVISAFPGATGLMADLGGGSLELVRLQDGCATDHATLPLGVLRLGGLSSKQRIALASKSIASLPWLQPMRGQPVFLVGGAWRALARLRIAASSHPIPIVHHFALTGEKAVSLAAKFAASSPAALAATNDKLRPRRLSTVPSGSAVLKALLDVVAPTEVLFSAYGLREGLLYDRLPAAIQADEPFSAACRQFAQRDGRSLRYAEALDRWLERAGLPGLEPYRETRTAAALLSEIAWRTHPDFRAADAFARVARMPFVGIDHPTRVFLALAVATRYQSDVPGDAKRAVKTLLSREARAHARSLGLALRLAERLSSGEPSVLDRSDIVLMPTRLALRVTPHDRPLVSGKARSVAQSLAQLLGRELEVAVDGSG